jgi:8-hydroxy-5-deazaflavin:NADPH oxidoreductase
MKFAIIGAGNVGTAIARAVTAAGHEATVAAPSEGDLDKVAANVPVRTTTSTTDAVADADAVALAVPFTAVQGIAAELAEALAAKIVIDVTNPLASDLSGLATEGASAAELVQRAAPQARVVKAFNTVLASNQAAGEIDGVQLDGFVAGDDADAKQAVSDLLAQIGFRPIDVGSLSAARYLEGMAYLNIALNARNGWSWRSGWKLVGPLA